MTLDAWIWLWFPSALVLIFAAPRTLRAVRSTGAEKYIQ